MRALILSVLLLTPLAVASDGFVHTGEIDAFLCAGAGASGTCLPQGAQSFVAFLGAHPGATRLEARLVWDAESPLTERITAMWGWEPEPGAHYEYASAEARRGTSPLVLSWDVAQREGLPIVVVAMAAQGTNVGPARATVSGHQELTLAGHWE